jgi:SAM-dependent methyltransferase
MSADDERLITHTETNQFDMDLRVTEVRGNLNPILPIDEKLKILSQLTEFDLGNFLLQNRGINGYWTSYWLIHGPKIDLTHPLENWLINRSPSFRASQERLKIFWKVISESLRPNMRLASIPCGLMDDLLRVDYSEHEGIELAGFDLDNNSLELAAKNVKELNSHAEVSFSNKGAWHLDVKDQFDLLTSNGLNFYEPDDQKVVELYKQFYQALRKDGILLTSFLTPPPGSKDPSPWKDYDQGDARKQRALFVDILKAKWSATRTEEKTRQQLEDAGFKEIQFLYDKSHIFPTVIARKR